MKHLIYILLLWTCLGIGGCENKEYLYCDVSSRIWLGRTDTVGNIITVSDSVLFSFMLSDSGMDEDTLYVVANLTGQLSAQDRPFELAVVKEGTNVPDSCYKTGKTVMPANAFKVYIPVVVKKDIPGMDLRKESACVTFRILPNDYFLPGDYEQTDFRAIWCNYLIQPDSWTYWITSYVGPFSQSRYKFIIDHTGTLEFGRYQSDFNATQAFVSELRELLAAYNANPANATREEGWPYKDDDGSDLTF